MSAVPAHCPYKAGDRVRLHGYPGYAEPWLRRGFRGVVEDCLGGTILAGTTDDGELWMERWGSLLPDGTPSDGRCTCCPRPSHLVAPVQLALFELAGAS